VPPSPGDTSILGYRVFDATGKQRLGRMSGICVSTDRRGRDVQCSGLRPGKSGCIAGPEAGRA
jgi:hypothetical protein